MTQITMNCELTSRRQRTAVRLRLLAAYLLACSRLHRTEPKVRYNVCEFIRVTSRVTVLPCGSRHTVEIDLDAACAPRHDSAPQQVHSALSNLYNLGVTPPSEAMVDSYFSALQYMRGTNEVKRP